MRNFVAIAIVLSVAGCFSMEPRVRLAEEDRVITQVIEAPGHAQAQIYGATVLWIVEKFESAKSLDYENRQDGTLIVKRALNLCRSSYEAQSGKCRRAPFTMRFEAKDNRFKITYTDILIVYPARGRIRSYSEPVEYQDQMDEIKPLLLKNGPEILDRVNRGSNSDTW
ncbi:MAG: DUF4468 domain-containing protein [Proteobacteria bacterium]|jgi:predicted thioredoxin/glutaredoxin|nr:DUF4468 domain-containing protein [Pseudomonadota bacterium]